MKTKSLMILAVSLVITGCSISTEKFRAPTGKEGYNITCKDPKACYGKAKSLCPEGYTNIKSPSGEQTEQNGTRVVIECN